MLKKTTNRLSELDALRGIAALSFVFFHYFYHYHFTYNSGPEISIAKYGHYGVQLFFFISGFVIYLSVNAADSTSSFLKSRFIRLYPTYWVALLISFAVVTTFGLEGREVTPNTALINLTMFGGYFGTKYVDGVYWTLSIELAFYLIIALAFTFRCLRYSDSIITLLTLFYIFLNKSIHYEFLPFERVWLFSYSPYFVIGIFFYKQKYQRDLNLGSYASIFLTIALLIYQGSAEDIVALILLIAIFYAALFTSFTKSILRHFVFFGKISYALYLAHQNLGFVIIQHSKDLKLSYRLYFIFNNCLEPDKIY
ncbi:acyltransferase family protein [Pokkaliibacter sp. CJK22405]|uniref:acyltransferase family protein n=1 Tax=Pokkaliibacter sp. CJK22405 TaxID=3384615 RepID=UPI003985551C